MANAQDTEAVAAPPVRQRLPGLAPPSLSRGPGGLPNLAGMIGNKNMGRLLARSSVGSGLLPGGLVHPDVEAGIAAVSGGGMALDTASTQRLEAGYGTTLGDVRVHTGDHAANLARAVSAEAFTVGRDIFFGQDAYRPGTPSGDALVAHEVAHVVQQRGAPATGPLLATQPGDAAETGAEAAVRGLGF